MTTALQRRELCAPEYHTGKIDGSRRDAFSWKVMAWITNATISMVTSKHILTSRNYHYPLHLLLLQLLVSLAILLAWELVSRHVYATTSSRWSKTSAAAESHEPPKLLGYVSYFGSAICLALSWPLFYQAMLHFPNLPTLLMISSLAFLVNMLLSQALLESSNLSWFRSRLFCATIASVMIIFDEYRLEGNGLFFSISAMILLGTSRALYQTQHSSDNADDHGAWGMFHLFTIALSTLVTALWSSRIEEATISLKEITPVFCLNVATSVVSIVLGVSMITHMEPVHALLPHEKYSIRRVGTSAYCGLAVVGLTAYISVQDPIPSYSSVIQTLAFLISVTCWTTWSFSNPMHDQESRIGFGYADAEQGSAQNLLEDEIHHDSSKQSGEIQPVPLQDELEPSFSERAQLSFARIFSHSLMLLVATSWILLIFQNLGSVFFAKNGPVSIKSRLDLGYTPNAQLDIVVSMYEESIDSITALMQELNKIPLVTKRNPRLIIYQKNEDADVDVLKQETGAFEVIKRPNVGREGETYLHHITTRWDDLAKQTLFIQAGIHNPREFYPRIRDYFVPETGMLSLGFSGHTCNCLDCGDVFSWSDTNEVIPRVYAQVYNQTCSPQDNVLLAYKGQFIASSARIRGIERSVYEELHAQLVDPRTQVEMQPDGSTSSLSAPVFGYTVERLWSILLQCSDMSVAARCPSLLSGTRRWGNVQDCQCLDNAGNAAGNAAGNDDVSG